VLHANSDNARKLLTEVIPRVGIHLGTCAYGCDRALEYAVMTAPEARDPVLLEKLAVVAGRVLKPGGVA
jgi:5'-methylthioadenosine phosphorylase